MKTFNKQNIVIIGASGHAKVIIDIIEKLNHFTIVGLIDSYKPIGTQIFDYMVLGRKEDVPLLKKTYNFNKGIIAIGDNWARKINYEKLTTIDPDFEFISAVHPNAIIGKNVSIGMGAVILAGVIINSDAIVGDFCIINTKASLGHDSQIKKYSSLGPNATVGGHVSIKTCTYIAMSATIIQSIKIGKHSIVGSGALIVRDVPDFNMVYGVPGKFIRKVAKAEKYFYHKNNTNT
ncbi:acetyltransferase [Hwangdonia lutea]|uniref:Acetyltransferase n=1 Tax=Hwangdonia lutea TaxID=3075823 RepID=A0AA97EKY9_9FLAO|nr:acetyltransferase [Hwangdonia sp. SCSIO 19198]WOD43374.1 acetyltransferase [Hwangdonia sp. SCSIO 19198]